ncbi:hypothetical protein [Streptomyces sp. WAC04114]|uniref:hypothetical protein n=1 Tax=Streptomyces sp. WAC04114 TaxID=2867961 RepID=UPI001C8CEF11|nr:hypothetical protein [Streptomyces sp. WAC04114]MBX9360948.1 hypothetical protein [Streptomyces sp. WAC04114]
MGDGSPVAHLRFFALRRLRSRLAVRTLLTSGRLTVEGHALVPGLARTLDGRLRDDVPPAAPARARTAAALHRTEWRLRNVVPTPAADPSDLRFRRDRTVWPDVPTHAFATRPAVPRTADEHLAAGDAAAALTAVRRRPGRRPGGAAGPRGLGRRPHDRRTGPGRPPDARPAGGVAGAVTPV